MLFTVAQRKFILWGLSQMTESYMLRQPQYSYCILPLHSSRLLRNWLHPFQSLYNLLINRWLWEHHVSPMLFLMVLSTKSSQTHGHHEGARHLVQKVGVSPPRLHMCTFSLKPLALSYSRLKNPEAHHVYALGFHSPELSWLAWPRAGETQCACTIISCAHWPS